MSLLIEKNRRVLQITLNRPEKRNALTSKMCQDISEAIEAVQNDAEIGSVLIDGSGQSFCAGMDLEEAVSPAGLELGTVHERLFTIGFHSLKPIVIAVNGAALGGGLGLVAQGHIVVAERTSVFALPEIRIGLWPFLVYRAIESSIGARRTLALSLTAQSFNAEEGLAWGLVQRVCADGEGLDCASNIARDVAASSAQAIEAGMTYVRDSRGKSLQEAGEIAGRARDELMISDDFRERVAAFKRKR